MKKAILFVLLVFVGTSAFSQWLPKFLLTSPSLQENNSNKLTIDVDAVGFFKNNEYFSPLSKGQTFPGIRIEPTIGFQIDNKLQFKLGIIGRYLSGDQKKHGLSTFNELFARIQYAILPNLNLVFGNLYGGANHQLVEPLYRWERQMVDKPESGLQLLYNDDRFFADVWVDWRRYIEHGDSVPEVLNFGLSASARLTPKEKNFRVTVPFQLTIYHQGGQIDTSDEKMVVVGNVATGIKTNWNLRQRIFHSIDFDTYLLGYFDKKPAEEIRPYKKGWAIYPVITFNVLNFKLMTGYWHGNKFFSYDGDPIFSSFNPMYPEEIHAKRQIVTNKISYFKQLHKYFSLGAQMETYFDTKESQFDYSFGIALRVNAQLFGKKY
jgi:hypothetical protein